MLKLLISLAGIMMILSAASASAGNDPGRNSIPGQPVCEAQCAADEVSAHLLAGSLYLERALSERREYSWHVYRMPDETYSYSFPEKGRVGSTSARTPAAHGRRPVSTGHVHWDGQKHFSGLDWLWVRSNQRPLYLINTRHELRVLPVKQVRMIRRNGRTALIIPESTYPGRVVYRDISSFTASGV